MTGPTLDEQVRAGCACGREVWLARQRGGVAVYSADTRTLLHELPLPLDGKARSQIHGLTVARGDIWLTTVDGELLCVEPATRKIACSLRLPGTEKKAALHDLCGPADGSTTSLLAVASATGRVFLIDPFSRKLLFTLGMPAACTAVAQCGSSLVIAGDADGGLYGWDVSTVTASTGVHAAACVNTSSKSGVRRLLFEPSTETIWVARENGNVDVYCLSVGKGPSSGGLTLARRVASTGNVTSMTPVSGKVILTTYDRKLVTVSAESAAVLDVRADSHRSFICSLVKVCRMETARLWSFGSDEAVHEWEVEGFAVPSTTPRKLARYAPMTLAATPLTALLADNASLGMTAGTLKDKAVSATEELRTARAEAQEMRLRTHKLEETIQVKDKELASRVAQIKELEEANAKLCKEVVDITSKVTNTERERGILQDDLTRARSDLTSARTESSARLTEKSKVEESLSTERIAKTQLEQRLRDCESKLATVQAENARLCASMGSVAVAQSAEKEVQQRILQGSAQSSADLQAARRLNEVLGSVVASMEYTLRRREEEEKDVVALLNAYRRKAAGHVTDSFLSALLLATMVRHPERFDLECDEGTKEALRARNGPFIQFVHSLRQTDPDTYERLTRYLQQCATAAGEEAIGPESRQLLDRFVELAAKEGAVGDAAVLALRHSIPGTVSAASPTGGVCSVPGAVGAVGPIGSAAATAAVAAPAAPAGGSLPPASGALDRLLSSAGGTPAGDKRPDEDFAGSALLRELRSQRAAEDNYLQEHMVMFEFILKTRRALVDGLVLLQKRIVSSQQVVDALSTSGSPVSAAGAMGSAELSPSKSARAASAQSITLSVLRELVVLVGRLVTQFLTDSEKRRLNVQ